MRHVIIGTGTAGVIAAETIRKNAPDDDILMIGNEMEAPYSRSAIPRLLTREIQETDTCLRKEQDYFGRLRIQQKFGRVVRINSQSRTLKLADDSVVPFDKLLIATGAAPRVPLIPGVELPGVHSCWTIDDARKIMQVAKPKARVVLIGAGFIGCILMEALAACGINLMVVEKKDHMLPNMMSEGGGRMVKQWCQRKGIKVRTATQLNSIVRNTQDNACPLIVMLSNGEKVPADLVIHATGTVANIGFLQGSGIKCLQGIVVDASMRTNIPDIYAAGDCAETFDMDLGRSVIAGVQPNAADQAYCAALNMVGKTAFQRGVRKIDVLDTMGLICSSFGQWKGLHGGQWVELSDYRDFKYLRLEFHKDVLIGCNAIGLTAEQAGVLRSMIKHQVQLGEWKDVLLEDPTRLKEAYVECIERQYMYQASTFRTTPGSRAEPMRRTA